MTQFITLFNLFSELKSDTVDSKDSASYHNLPRVLTINLFIYGSYDNQ